MSENKQGLEVVQENAERRLPYVVWTVKGTDYKLKLTTANIVELEDYFNKKNLILVVMPEDGIPTLSVMLRVIQKSMTHYQHGIGITEAANIFDDYFDEGGTQTALLEKVLMPLMTVSGFFTTDEMSEAMTTM